MNRARLIAGIILFLGLFSHQSQAQNLNKKYGPSWDCSYITAGHPLYDDCKPCQNKGKEFWQDTENTGHCVDKEGSAASEDEDTPSGRSVPNNGTARRDRTGQSANPSTPYYLTVPKPSSGTCPAGYNPARNMRSLCVRKDSAECYYAPITCPLNTSSGCCFNTHTPPADNVKGHFCCPRGTQCVFEEGPDRGVCQR